MEPPKGPPGVGHCMRSFEPYLEANHRVENPVMHISLNPSPKDKLSDEQLERIAREYLKKLGYGNQPYIIYKHEDIGRPHLHILTTCIKEQGRKINDFQIWKRSWSTCRHLERKYGLHPAEKQDYSYRQPLTAVDYKASDLKRQIANVVKGVLQQYRFQSLKEFKAVLGLYRVTLEEIRGQAAGRDYAGVVYAATDEKGNRVGLGIKSSSIGKSTGLPALQRKIGMNKGWLTKHPPSPELRQTIAEALRFAPTKEAFVDTLKTRNIDTVLWQNDAGHLYGVTYIDHRSRCVFKGSALGKECSATAINRQYHPLEYGDTHPLEQEDRHTARDGMSLSEAMLDLFTFESYPHPFLEDPEPRNPYGRKKKKKKKGQQL